jgi:hypothetical protein
MYSLSFYWGWGIRAGRFHHIVHRLDSTTNLLHTLHPDSDCGLPTITGLLPPPQEKDHQTEDAIHSSDIQRVEIRPVLLVIHVSRFEHRPPLVERCFVARGVEGNPVVKARLEGTCIGNPLGHTLWSDSGADKITSIGLGFVS